jgi:transposase
MSRPLNFHKPTGTELRTLLHGLESVTDPIIRKRIEVIVWLCVTPIATEVAQLLNVSLRTILYYVRCFNRGRLRWIMRHHPVGRTRQISRRTEQKIVTVAQHDPSTYGLPYGTWSLARLQWFITKKCKWLRSISREHLRRLLKKTICTCVVSSARSTPRIHTAKSF